MKPERLFRIIERLVPVLLPISNFLNSIPLIGTKLRWAVPIAYQKAKYPQLSKRQLAEWALLDTFDMYGPAYDQPQSGETSGRGPRRRGCAM